MCLWGVHMNFDIGKLLYNAELTVDLLYIANDLLEEKDFTKEQAAAEIIQLLEKHGLTKLYFTGGA